MSRTNINLFDAIAFCRRATEEQRKRLYEALKVSAQRESAQKLDAFNEGDYAWFETKPREIGFKVKVYCRISAINRTTITAKVVRTQMPRWINPTDTPRGYKPGMTWRCNPSLLTACTKAEATGKKAA